MKRTILFAALMGGCLLGAAAMAATDPVAERVHGFKASKRALVSIKAAIDSGDTAGIALSAQDMAVFAKSMPDLFPPGSEGGFFSGARKDLWAHFPDFVEKAKAFERQADEMARLAGKAGTDQATLQSSYQKLTDTCMACHRSYKRGP